MVAMSRTAESNNSICSASPIPMFTLSSAGELHHSVNQLFLESRHDMLEIALFQFWHRSTPQSPHRLVYCLVWRLQ
jgi:hypothetical protein